MPRPGTVKINPSRLLNDLHKLRSFGAAAPYVKEAKGGDGVRKGVVRPALTSEDIEARKWLLSRCREAGMETKIDCVGNTIAYFENGGGNIPKSRLLCGSHSDTQPTGGWLDGALGVVYAIEAARSLGEIGIRGIDVT